MKNHILFIVENETIPFDVRVWYEALAAKEFGFEVTVLCPLGKRAPLRYEKLEGIEIYRHPMPIEASGKFAFIFEYLNSIIWQLLYSIRIYTKKPFHYIHAANPPDLIFLTALFFRLFGTKFIFDHHDICPENYLVKFGRKDIFYRILLMMERLTFKTASIIISTNESYKDIAIERGKKSRNRVFVVRNGPGIGSVSTPLMNPKWKDGFDYLVAYIGGIGKQERIDVLLQIVKYIVFQKKIRTIKFIIVGTGPHWKSMVRMSEKMRLCKYVQFTGFIPVKDVYEIFSNADLCVNPEYSNSFTEKSTMIKIMDYMLFGIPIVQFNSKEGKITSGKSSVYIDNNDESAFAEAIIDLINDPKKREKMGYIGKKRIEQFLSWDKQKVFLKDAYEYLEKLF